MVFVSHRRLAIPLWAVAFFTVAVTVPPSAEMFLMPPTTLFAIAAVGIAAIVFLMPPAITFLRTSRSLVRVVPSGYPDSACARIVAAAGAGVRKLHEPNATDADDALDLVRMDDDGGWQMTRPQA
jgi:hypothetical protein